MGKRSFLALAAPSGGGKTTLCKMLLSKYPHTTVSTSYTTRRPRGQERDGVEYHFVTREKFESLIQKNEFIEWAEVHGNLYGTSKNILEEQSKTGKTILLDVDVQGVDSLKAVFGDRCLSVFILPPSMEALEERLRSRNTESEEKIQERLAAAKLEMKYANRFDRQIINTELEKSFQELCVIFEKEFSVN